MPETVSIVDQLERIQRAVGLCVIHKDDERKWPTLIFTIGNLLGQRAIVAKRYLSCADEDTKKQLKELYDYIDIQLKQLLVL